MFGDTSYQGGTRGDPQQRKPARVKADQIPELSLEAGDKGIREDGRFFSPVLAAYLRVFAGSSIISFLL
jgi:hypothetical protein